MLLVVALVGAFFAGWWWRGQEPMPAAPVDDGRARMAARQKVDDCRDACEQRFILEKLTDEWLRACRSSCGGEPARPWEQTRSVTRAPADHSRSR